MNMKTLAWHGSHELKAEKLKLAKQHQNTDRFIQGYGWWKKNDSCDFKGCFFGCMTQLNSSDSIDQFCKEIGIPRLLGKLMERMFEGSTKEYSLTFPYNALESIPVGADLSLVFYEFMHWMLSDLLRFNNHQSIRDIIQLFQRKINGEQISIEEWRGARAAAADADADAAYAAAAYAAADAAAYAAADADAAYAAADADAAYAAADAAAYAAAAYAAKTFHYNKMAEKLLQIIKSKTVVINNVKPIDPVNENPGIKEDTEFLKEKDTIEVKL